MDLENSRMATVDIMATENTKLLAGKAKSKMFCECFLGGVGWASSLVLNQDTVDLPVMVLQSSKC